MCKTILLTLALFALAAAAFAAPPPSALPQAPAAVAAPQGACAHSLELLAPDTQAVCKTAAPAQPEFMVSTTKYRGYCACGCSFVRDCNTSADCGGSACLAGVTCC